MAKTKEKSPTIPTSVGEAGDALYLLRKKRLDLQKKVDELKAEEKTLTDYLIENLPEHGAQGVVGKLCKVNIVTKEIPVVEGDNGWDLVGDYIKRNWKRVGLSLLQRRLNQGAVNEILASGKSIPGVGIMEQKTLSVTKK